MASVKLRITISQNLDPAVRPPVITQPLTLSLKTSDLIKNIYQKVSGPLQAYAVVIQTDFCLLPAARKWMKGKRSVGESSNYRYLWAVSIPPPLRLQVVILIHSESRGSLHLELVCIKYRPPFIWASPSCLYDKGLFWDFSLCI